MGYTVSIVNTLSAFELKTGLTIEERGSNGGGNYRPYNGTGNT